MPRTSVALLIVAAVAGAAPAPAAAGPEAEVASAFTGFVDGVAMGEPLPRGLELFITPFADDIPLPTDFEPLMAMFPAPEVKVLQVVPSKSGRSAWLAAEISAVPVGARKPPGDVVRATAVLALERGAWTVRASHWSVGVRNVKPSSCGMLGYEWRIDPAVPATIGPRVKAVLEALDSGKAAAFLALLSADKRAVVFGSAPKETFVGGAKIKGVFKKWTVALPYWDKDDPALPGRAGVTPDGELTWMVAGVAYFKLCTSYRTMFVMAPEKGAWKIVHQHYSEPTTIE